MCHYSVVVGDETPFPGADATSFSDTTDGTSNTILVIERLLPVCWMDPNHEIPFDTAAKGVSRDWFGIGSAHIGGANAVLVDGSINFVSKTMSPETLRASLTKAAGDQ